MSIQDLVGSLVVFSADPFYSGTATIQSFEEDFNKWIGESGASVYLLEIRTVDCSVTSRLGAHSRTDVQEPTDLRIYWFTREQIERAIQFAKDYPTKESRAALARTEDGWKKWGSLRHTFPV